MTLLRRTSYGALALAFAHIVFGAIVRITGSGLGCGNHWPQCEGYWFPPFARTDLVIEVTHRYLAFGLSLTIAGLLAMAFARRATPGVAGRGGVLRPVALAAALVVTAAVLGGIAVKLELRSTAVIVLHLAIAITTLASLAMAIIRAGGLGGAQAVAGSASARTWRGARAAAVMAFVIVALGGLTAHVVGANGACVGFPACSRGIPTPGTPLHIHLAHRILAFLLVGHLLGLMLGVRRRGESALMQWATRIAFGTVVLQVLVAAALVELHLPPVLRSLHQAMGVLVWLSIFVMAALARRGSRVAIAEVTRIEPATDNEAMRPAAVRATSTPDAVTVVAASTSLAPIAAEPAAVATLPTVTNDAASELEDDVFVAEPPVVSFEPEVLARMSGPVVALTDQDASESAAVPDESPAIIAVAAETVVTEEELAEAEPAPAEEIVAESEAQSVEATFEAIAADETPLAVVAAPEVIDEPIDDAPAHDAVDAPRMAEAEIVIARAIEPDESDTAAIEPTAVEANAVEASAVEANAIDEEAIGEEAIEASVIGATAIEADALEVEPVEANGVDHVVVAADAIATDAIEPEALETDEVEVEAVEAGAIEAEAVASEAVAGEGVEAVDASDDVVAESDTSFDREVAARLEAVVGRDPFEDADDDIDATDGATDDEPDADEDFAAAMAAAFGDAAEEESTDDVAIDDEVVAEQVMAEQGVVVDDAVEEEVVATRATEPAKQAAEQAPDAGAAIAADVAVLPTTPRRPPTLAVLIARGADF